MPIKNIKIIDTEILSDNWYTLKKVTFEYINNKGEVVRQSREAYDRGNGSVILLYNTQLRTVILVKQFRLPSYINGNETGMLIEACAGLLDEDNPEDCIRRETEEETGYKVENVKRIAQAYMSPGSVTEVLYFFIAEYSPSMKINEGGGIDNEDIEVLELDFDRALQMIETGEIKDGKTIMMLYHLRVKNIL